MKRLFHMVIGLLFLFQVTLRADEGMWLLSLIGELNMDEMTDMGLELTADQIYSVNQSSLKDAVGALNGGECTAELVSPEGLLLTNHHCAYEDIQYLSTVEHDYLKNGFWAMTREEELPILDKTITFLVRMEEVTGRILPVLNEQMTPGERESQIRVLSGAIASDATQGTHYEAEVKEMFEGNRFFLIVTETYRDVRLVGAPPESIGKFGGDTDNWMWPRHTGDFSIYRVYTGLDGKPADYQPDNIPLKSKYFLPISLKGYEKEDFTMVVGSAGSTDRYMTSYEIRELLEVVHPNRILIRGIKQDLMMEDMMADEQVRLQYASKHALSANYWKYSIGQSEGLRKLDVLGRQQEREAAFREWVSQSGEREAQYGDVLDQIREVVEQRREMRIATQYLEETILRSGYETGMEAVEFARDLQFLERVMAYPDAEDWEIRRTAEILTELSADFYRNYNPSTDKKVMKAMVRLLLQELDDRYLPQNLLQVKEKFRGDVDRYVEWFFKKSFVTDQQKFLAFMQDPSLKVLRKDPAYQAAVAVGNYFEINGRLAEINESFEENRRLYLKGLMEMNPQREYYPDANRTLRMNYGSVNDYIPRDAVLYTHFTTLSGVMEKEDPDNFEFVVPERLKALFLEGDFGPYGEDGRMQVCFLSNNDITGGNSGSPVINASGELIGIAFDGNWEAMSGDIAFENDLQRCINVDIRYVLFIIDNYAGAGHLLEEMTLVQ